MKHPMKFIAGAACIAMLSTTAFANGKFDNAIKAREATMTLYSFNLGMLGAMLKGDVEYDAKLAQALANNLKAAAEMDQSALWPQGSSSTDAEYVGKTRALVKAWETYPEVANKHKALVQAAADMASAAGTGVDGIKANIGAVGGACQGCHEAFRAPKN